MQSNYFTKNQIVDVLERPTKNSSISSQIIYGEKDELVSRESIDDLKKRLRNQKGIDVTISEIKNVILFRLKYTLKLLMISTED